MTTPFEKAVWRSAAVPSAAKVLALALRLTRGQEAKTFFFDRKTHAAELGLSETEFKGAVQRLLDKGLFALVEKPHSGRRAVYRLRIPGIPESEKENEIVLQMENEKRPKGERKRSPYLNEPEKRKRNPDSLLGICCKTDPSANLSQNARTRRGTPCSGGRKTTEEKRENFSSARGSLSPQLRRVRDVVVRHGGLLAALHDPKTFDIEKIGTTSWTGRWLARNGDGAVSIWREPKKGTWFFRAAGQAKAETVTRFLSRELDGDEALVTAVLGNRLGIGAATQAAPFSAWHPPPRSAKDLIENALLMQLKGQKP